MTSAGGVPFADIGGRMAVFGQLFGEQVGVRDPGTVPSAEDLVALVRTRVPRKGSAIEDSPVFEAAAYVGEWMRARSHATWVAEGPYEPHLQVVDASHAIVYLIPVVSILRTASTAGYDGLPRLLARILDDVSTASARVPLDELRVRPLEEREAVVGWIRRYRHLRDATRAALWRRCSACASVAEDAVTLHQATDDWEAEASTAATILSQRPFRCACDGLPGDVTRFLMLRAADGGTRVADIQVTSTHTRIGCWTLDGDFIEPFDALSLAADDVFGGG